jgi:hypothetical protein
MKKLLVVTLLAVLAIAVVPVSAQAGGTETSGVVTASSIAGIAVGDNILVSWNSTNGTGEVIDVTAATKAECAGGTADPAPSTRIDQCVVNSSNISGLGVGVPLALALAFRAGAPQGAPLPIKVVTLGTNCNPISGLECSTSAGATLSKLSAN